MLNDKSSTSLNPIQRRQLFTLNLKQCEEAAIVIRKRILQLKKVDTLHPHNKEIKDLQLSNRAKRILYNASLITIGDIFNYGEKNLIYLRGCGETIYKQILEEILKYKECEMI